MKTVPDIPFEEHLRDYCEWLRQYSPVIGRAGTAALRWYDYYDARLDAQGRTVLARAAIGTVETLRRRFEQLNREGKGWVSFGAAGALNDSEYLIALEYDRDAEGHPAMAVNRGGPPLGVDGSVRQMANVLTLD